jgi:hypothetical protein
MVWIPNGVDLADFPFSAQQDNGSEFELVYLGGHTASYDLDVLLRAFGSFERTHTGRPVRLGHYSGPPRGWPRV